MQAEILTKVTKLAKEWAIVTRPEGIRPDDRFVEDLAFDSLDRVEMVMAVEEAFDIGISDEEAERVLTIADAVALVVEKQSQH
jgi:acyl carrier protein